MNETDLYIDNEFCSFDFLTVKVKDMATIPNQDLSDQGKMQFNK